MNYTRVTMRVEDIINDIYRVETIKPIEILSEKSNENQEFINFKLAMQQILNIDEKAIPSRIDSIGHGIRFDKSPYFNDVSTIVKQVKEKAEKFGLENLIQVNPLLLKNEMTLQEVKAIFVESQKAKERTDEINREIKGSDASLQHIINSIKHYREQGSSSSNINLKP